MNIKQWSATRILSVGFAFIIIVGALALSLPFASRDGAGIPFLNALFTSASATCVTGLVLYDTWTQFSGFGQLVILLLIQTGGLGFMAVAILFSLAIGRRIGLRERSLLSEAVSSMQVGGVVRLVRRMLIGTAIFEIAGALLLAVRFIPMFGVWRGLWLAVFHSVSALCNAGFDLMGIRTPSSSLTYFVIINKGELLKNKLGIRFIRRIKENVLKDLPPKYESVNPFNPKPQKSRNDSSYQSKKCDRISCSG
jgi:trk system potassium uptake protein TrkH